ncbi:glycerol-3-phosphate acyltransferas-like protein [Pseudovirgaria hyperparasitica]|uniref:Glycerol-3-phosphate acyltransferas-like protein n=1 Tax=Pseudovirgaria hyperparasitica TaxID=470096 RepID=A0A6A6VXL5_9PEZI|nr:glycerol-3-phosphate acyltransferas-like protein [Pseudovirgaria hyperparasitica]KAF2754546.1 glycerol-3-phosphate acyltransferas-like protein [Pseudovirgaria hyperparasitica]
MPSSRSSSPAAAARDASTAAPDISIRGDHVALHPAGYDAPSSEENLIDNMARFRTSPMDFLREVSLYVSGTGWRSYDSIVGQPIFYSGFSERMKNRVMQDVRVQERIAKLAGGRVDVEIEQGTLGKKDRARRRQEIGEQIREVAEDITDNMICKMESKSFIRGAYYLATQLLTRAYHQGIHVSSEEVLRLRAVATEAAKNKQSIVFLPCHRSHVDYVSLQLVCYRLGLALPTVVAGDNLNFPLVGTFLQHAGAMWIRRSFGDDQLYVTMVQAYIDVLLQDGFNFECFVEGGRSRTGKLLPPKFGVLSYILDSVLSGRVKDTIICPVSTQYDKVIEVDSYISELLGQPKQKENLMDFLSASSILSLKLGRVDVRFHEPWSLRGFIDQQIARYSKMPKRIDDKETRLRLLRTLGYRVLSEINEVSVVMPTALIGTVLLTLRGRGVGKSELIRRVEWLSDRVRSQGGRVAHFSGLPTSVVVERGLDVLGADLVGVVQGLPEDTYYAVDRFQLSFYRNMTIHLFILQALTSASMYIRVKQGGGRQEQRISYTELRDHVYFLSQLFRGEFIFPTEGLEANLGKTIRSLENDDVVTVVRDGPSPIRFVELSERERERGRENFDFYCFLIWPFIEASWLGAVSLIMLTPPIASSQVWLETKKVQDQAQLLGKTLYHQGDLSYFEAVNKETLKNAYQRFEEEGIIVSSAKTKDSKVPPTLRLADDWRPSRDPKTGRILAKGKLWDWAEMISQSRREGKNRRDGATVQTRVLALVEICGQQLFDDAAAAAKPVAPLGPEPDKKQRRRRTTMGKPRANL